MCLGIYLCAALAALGAASVDASGAYTAPHPISATNAAAVVSDAEVAANGSAIVIWVQYPHEPNARNTHALITASRRRTLGGRWSRPRDISPRGYAQIPRLALTANGGAVAAWESTKRSSTEIQAAVMSPSGSWGRPQMLGTGQFPWVASSGRDAVLVWNRYDGRTETFSLRSSWLRRGRWVRPRTVVSRLNDASNTYVALNGRGRGWIVAASAPRGFTGEEGLFAWPINRYRVGEAHALTRRPVGYGPADVCTAPGRAVTAVWFDGAIRSASYSTSGRFSGVTRLAEGGGFPSCDTNEGGDTLVGWVEPQRKPGAFVAFRARGTKWAPADNLANADDLPFRIGVELRDDRTRAVYWSAGSTRGEPSRLQAAAYTAAGWQVPDTVATGGIGYVDIASAGSSPALLSWNTRARIYVADEAG